MLFYIGLALCLLGIILWFFVGKRIFINEELKQINEKIIEENANLEYDNTLLKQEKVILKEQIHLLKEKQEDIIVEQQNAANNYADVLETAYQKSEESYDLKIQNLKEKYKQLEHQVYQGFERYCDILDQGYTQEESNYDNKVMLLEKDFQTKVNKLNDIKKTLAAATEAQLRAKEMESKVDFYSLHLTEQERIAVNILEELKPKFPAPRALSKVVWETFFQKQATALCNNILGSNVVSGIYKITNQKTNQHYIGQSVDIATRWKDHIKCGLGIDTPVQNKLYQAMNKDGITNFTFELLEKCDKTQLNEKEKFYIDLYQSYEFGYNSTKGNK